MATMTIYHIGERVRVAKGPFTGMTGTVRAHTRLPVENIHIVDYDAPTEQQVTATIVNGRPEAQLVPFESAPFSGPYGEFKPEELESVGAA